MKQPWNSISGTDKQIHPLISFMISDSILRQNRAIFAAYGTPQATIDAVKHAGGQSQAYIDAIIFYDDIRDGLTATGFQDDVNGFRILSDFKKNLDNQYLSPVLYMSAWGTQVNSYVQSPTS
jgi:hypothetical protein